MPRQKQATRAEKKTRLMARAEALIDQRLDWTEATDPPNLTPMEDEARTLRQQFGQALVEAMLASQENIEPVALPACPQWDRPLRPKGRKSKTVLVRTGALRLERSHFYCPACERGLFPPR